MSSPEPQQIPSRPKSVGTMTKFDELSFQLHKYGNHELQRVGVWTRSRDALNEAIEATARLNNNHREADEADDAGEGEDVDKSNDPVQAGGLDTTNDDDVDMSEQLPENETASSSEASSSKGSSSKASASKNDAFKDKPSKDKSSKKLSKREKDRRRRRLKPVIDDTSPNQRPRWVIYIHGGAWRDPNITYESFIPTIKHLVNRTTPMPIAGFASIDYRLSAHPDFPQDADTPPEARREARHPDHIEDVCSALIYLICNHDIGFDYLLVGHSVGATLAFQVITRVLNTQAAKWEEERQTTIEHVQLSTAPQERIRKRKRSVGYEYGDQTGHGIHGDGGDFEERVHDKQAAIGLVGCDWQDETEGDETMQEVDQGQSSKSQPGAGGTAGGSSKGQMQADTALPSAETPTPGIASTKGGDPTPESTKVVLFEDLFPDKRAKDFDTDFWKIDESPNDEDVPTMEEVEDEERLDKELTEGETRFGRDDSDAVTNSSEEEGDSDDSTDDADDNADDWEDVESEQAVRTASVSNHCFPLPFAIVGVAGIYDFEGYNSRHGDDKTSFFAGAYGPHKAEWSLAAPARYGGQLAYWHARRVVVIGSSTEDEYIDEPETQSILERLTTEDIIYFANRCLRGSHDFLWQDGAQVAQLVVEALGRARVFPVGDWARIPYTKENGRSGGRTGKSDSKHVDEEDEERGGGKGKDKEKGKGKGKGKDKGGGKKGGKKGNKVKKGLKEERAGVGDEVE
jgi:hypothetical protein